MDPKPEDILTVDLTGEIDPTILLGLEFEKIKLISELDVANVLSEGDNKIIETNNTQKDFESQDSLTSDTNSESDGETAPSTELERKKDINGNEKTLSDYNLNRLFGELDLSDTDNEENDEEPSPKLRERGGPDRNRTTKNQNRTNFLKKSDKYNRSQIDPRYLRFLSGSSFVESSSASNYFPPENNNFLTFDPNEVFYNVNSIEPVTTTYPQFCEDSRANSIGSPESGYESSLTGSPPPTLPSTFINNRLELITQWDDDQKFINYVTEDPAICALTEHAVPTQLVDDKENNDEEKRINEILEYLKNTPCELVEVAPPDRETDAAPLEQSFEDINNFEIVLPPGLKDVGLRKLGYKLKNEAKKELRRILSQDKFWAAEEKIFKRLIEDKNKNKPIKVIDFIDEINTPNENRTNLHQAVLNENIEEIYCLVEIQKKYDLTFFDFNMRDKNNKTALDYAIEQHMHPAVIDYLKENQACQNVIV